MTMALDVKQTAPKTLQFSVREIPASERLAALRDLNDREILAQNLVPLDDHAVQAELVQRRFAGLGVLSAQMCGLRQEEKTRFATRPDNDDIFLGLNINGYRTAHQRGREVKVEEGGGLLLSRENGSFVIYNPAAVQFIGLLLPRARVSPLVPNLDESVKNMSLQATDCLGLLGKYLSALMEEQIVVTPDLQQLVATQVYDIVAAAIGATKDAFAEAEGRGVRAARLRAIKSHIGMHLDTADLSVTAIAACFKVTPRYVHKVFETEGITFSEYVLSQRLERAYRILTDPRFSRRSISSIAYDVGFGDLSYFNRVFRRCYQASPTQLRSAQRLLQ